MKILFFEPSGWIYDTTTPLKAPLGGTQSAVAYLSAALVRAGAGVMVVNGVPQPIVSDGVHFVGDCSTELLNGFDIVVVVSAAAGSRLRAIGCRTPMVLWCHHAADQHELRGLADEVRSDCYVGYAMVSDWQAQEYQAKFGIDPGRMRILRNAASPAFLGRRCTARWLSEGAPPVLAYTSTPYRGLDVLLLAFPAIRERLPGARLRVYSSMGIYQSNTEADKFEALYDACRALPGAEYIGPLPQPALAQALTEADILAYPSTFAETACISAMEAMALGCAVITTRLGALPETMAGFGYLIDVGGRSWTIPSLASFYADEFVRIAEARGAAPVETLRRLAAGAAFANGAYSWSARSTEWTDWLRKLI